MAPTDALDQIIYRATFSPVGRKQPGHLVLSSSPEVREALSRLTSADVLAMRCPHTYYDGAKR